MEPSILKIIICSSGFAVSFFIFFIALRRFLAVFFGIGTKSNKKEK